MLVTSRIIKNVRFTNLKRFKQKYSNSLKCISNPKCSTYSNHYYRFLKRNTKLRYTFHIIIGGTIITTANAISKNSNSNDISDDDDSIEAPSNPALNTRVHDNESLDMIYQKLISNITLPEHTFLMWCWLYLKRAIFLFINFTPLILMTPLAYLDDYNYGFRSYWLKMLPQTFGKGGSTFIKIGS